MRKKRLSAAAIGVLFGSIAVSQTLSRPSMANARTVDIVGLIGAGLSYGAALVALIMAIRNR